MTVEEAGDIHRARLGIPGEVRMRTGGSLVVAMLFGRYAAMGRLPSCSRSWAAPMPAARWASGNSRRSPFPLGQRFARVSVVEMGRLRCQSATAAMLMLTKPWTYSAWQKWWLEH